MAKVDVLSWSCHIVSHQNDDQSWNTRLTGDLFEDIYDWSPMGQRASRWNPSLAEQNCLLILLVAHNHDKFYDYDCEAD